MNKKFLIIAVTDLILLLNPRVASSAARCGLWRHWTTAEGGIDRLPFWVIRVTEAFLFSASVSTWILINGGCRHLLDLVIVRYRRTISQGLDAIQYSIAGRGGRFLVTVSAVQVRGAQGGAAQGSARFTYRALTAWKYDLFSLKRLLFLDTLEKAVVFLKFLIELGLLIGDAGVSISNHLCEISLIVFGAL